MPRRLTVAVVSLMAALAVFAFLAPKQAPAAERSRASEVFDFFLGEIEDHRRGSGPDMYGFLVSVRGDGRPEDLRTFLVKGTPPVQIAHQDHGRYYHWALLDSSGRTLLTGQHFDLIAAYAPHPEGGCDKFLLDEHTM
ncbi:MAG: hypothetical protein KDB53_15385, partial [Planctomycetes bacterium]|nr:hypothetical protein [Planctomycetota bacterium]